MVDGVQTLSDSKCDVPLSESERTEQHSLFISGKGLEYVKHWSFEWLMGCMRTIITEVKNYYVS